MNSEALLLTILFIVAVVEIVLAFEIKKLQIAIAKATVVALNVHEDIKKIVGHADTVVNTAKELASCDMKFKGKTPLGEAEIKLEIEKQVM